VPWSNHAKGLNDGLSTDYTDANKFIEVATGPPYLASKLF
jgi:hypothetical protein